MLPAFTLASRSAEVRPLTPALGGVLAHDGAGRALGGIPDHDNSAFHVEKTDVVLSCRANESIIKSVERSETANISCRCTMDEERRPGVTSADVGWRSDGISTRAFPIPASATLRLWVATALGSLRLSITLTPLPCPVWMLHSNQACHEAKVLHFGC